MPHIVPGTTPPRCVHAHMMLVTGRGPRRYATPEHDTIVHQMPPCLAGLEDGTPGDPTLLGTVLRDIRGHARKRALMWDDPNTALIEAGKCLLARSVFTAPAPGRLQKVQSTGTSRTVISAS